MRFDYMIQPQDVGFIAFGVVVGAVAVIAVQAGCEADVSAREPSLWTAPSYSASANDPIEEELARCRGLPPEKAGDPFCREFWAAQRRKFLTPNEAPKVDGAPLDLFPTVPKAQEPSSRAPAQKSE